MDISRITCCGSLEISKCNVLQCMYVTYDSCKILLRNDGTLLQKSESFKNVSMDRQAGHSLIGGGEAVSIEQALNKCVRIDDLCMLADEHPPLPMPCRMLCILRPLLLQGDRVPDCISFVRLQHEQSCQSSGQPFPHSE